MVRRLITTHPTPTSTAPLMAPPPTTPASPPINLLRGWPNPSLLPNDALLAAMNRVLPDKPLAAQGLLYGPDEGHLPLRKSLAKWLSEFYGPATKRWRGTLSASSSVAKHAHSSQESRISITGGASQNLGVILAALTDPLYTRRIWIVAPGYFMGFKIFEDAGFVGKMRAVPEVLPTTSSSTRRGNNENSEGDGSEWQGEAGPNIPWLRREMRKVDEKCERQEQSQTHASDWRTHSHKPPSKYPKVYRHVIYTVPSFANPSSLTTSLKTREELVRVAREFDALVVADDVYDMLQWGVEDSGATNTTSQEDGGDGKEGVGKAPLPRLVDIDRYLDGGISDADAEGSGYGNVVSNGSFSKICGPGARVGWVEAADECAFAVSQAGSTKSGGAPSQLMSLFLDALLNPLSSSPTISLNHHIKNTLLPAYSRRSSLLLNTITTHLLPLGCALPQPDRRTLGGYFTWVQLPEGVSAKVFAGRCKEDEGVVVAGGGLFEIPGDGSVASGEGSAKEDQERNVDGSDGLRFDGFVRLCWAWVEEDELVEGVQRVARCLQGILKESDGGMGGEKGGRGAGGVERDVYS